MRQQKEKFGRLFLALFVSFSLSVPMALAMPDDPDDPEAIKLCPPACRQIEYNSFEWFLSCFGLPRVCSATPNGRHQVSQRDLRMR